jgi:hypothetical protein
VSTTLEANLPSWVSMTPTGNFATGTAGVVIDTRGKFSAGVNHIGVKFATTVNTAGGK